MVSCGTKQPALLLAEDEPIIAAHLMTLLIEMGVTNIHSATTVQDANQIADHQVIDLALLDLNLADGSSLTLAKRLCSKRVAVIVMTGTSDFVLPRECHRALILVKPFSLRQLEKLMMGFLPKREAH